MDIHKPKPIHNWREFLKEVGIIVLGVCIALAAEQAVEWWHWNNRVRDAVEAMRLELRDDDGPQAFARQAMRGCYVSQLDAIQGAVETGRPRREIVALVNDYYPPSPTWDSHAWNVVLSSDVGAHVPPAQMMKWSGPYAFVPALAQRNAQEREDKTALQLTHREGEKLSAGETEAMLAAVAKLRQDNTGMYGFSGALLRRMRETGITLGEDQQDFILKTLRARFHDCVVVPSLALPNGPYRFPSLTMPQAASN
jgi:hypothetical protein